MKRAFSIVILTGATFADQSLAGKLIDMTAPPAGFTPVVGDAVWGLTGCTFTQGNTIATCIAPGPLSVFSNPPSMVVADDVGSGSGTSGIRIPQVFTIKPSGATFSAGTLTLTLATAPIFSNGPGSLQATHVAAFNGPVISGGSGYEFGTFQTLVCSSCMTGDGHKDAIGTPAVMMEYGSVMPSFSPVTPPPVAVACTLTPTTETGIGPDTAAGGRVQFIGTLQTSGIFIPTSVNPGSVIADYGTYTSSTGKYTDQTTGCGLSGSAAPTATFAYTVKAEQVVNTTNNLFAANVYQGPPPCQASAVSTLPATGVATGLMLSCTNTPAFQANYVGTTAYGTDNTAALQAFLGNRTMPAVGSMNYASSVAEPECLYLPGGNYLTRPLNSYAVGSSPTGGQGLAQGFGCWLGDERNHSNVFVIPNANGDVFAWNGSYSNNSLVALGNTQTFGNISNSGGTLLPNTANQGGSSFRNITIIGDRLSTKMQNGLAFYGKTQWAYINNVIIDYMPGRALYAGAADGAGSGVFSESVIQQVRFEDDGMGAAVPTMEITAGGTHECSNTDSISDVRIYQSLGTGMWIHNNGCTLNANLFRLANIMIEGTQVSATNLGGDLMEIGDPAIGHPVPGANVSGVSGTNVHLINPVVGFAALHIAGDTNTDTANINISGLIEGNSSVDPGRGVQIEACNLCNLHMVIGMTGSVTSIGDYDLLIGSPGTLGPCVNSFIGSVGVIYDDDGGEGNITRCIDPAIATPVQTPKRMPL